MGLDKTICSKGSYIEPLLKKGSTESNMTVMPGVRGNGEKILPMIVPVSEDAKKIGTIEITKDSITGYTQSGWVSLSILIKYRKYCFPFGGGLLVWD